MTPKKQTCMWSTSYLYNPFNFLLKEIVSWFLCDEQEVHKSNQSRGKERWRKGNEDDDFFSQNFFPFTALNKHIKSKHAKQHLFTFSRWEKKPTNWSITVVAIIRTSNKEFQIYSCFPLPIFLFEITYLED